MKMIAPGHIQRSCTLLPEPMCARQSVPLHGPGFLERGWVTVRPFKTYKGRITSFSVIGCGLSLSFTANLGVRGPNDAAKDQLLGQRRR